MLEWAGTMSSLAHLSLCSVLWQILERNEAKLFQSCFSNLKEVQFRPPCFLDRWNLFTNNDMNWINGFAWQFSLFVEISYRAKVTPVDFHSIKTWRRRTPYHNITDTGATDSCPWENSQLPRFDLDFRPEIRPFHTALSTILHVRLSVKI